MPFLPEDPVHHKFSLEAPVKVGKAICAASKSFATVESTGKDSSHLICNHLW